MRVLGIESSCDETAVAIVNSDREIISNQVLSQVSLHKVYGGVVPEIAARSHLNHIGLLINKALAESGIHLQDLDGIAATSGPGLIGGVLVGMMTAKGLSLATGLPFMAINHMEGHALTARLTGSLSFPYLALLISGGHSQFVSISDINQYSILGATIDDAAGEAFDKTAKLLGLGFPGGPAIENMAVNGDPYRFALPRPMLGRPNCDLSFSGLKTAVRHVVEKNKRHLDGKITADIAAGFQNAITDCLVDRCKKAMQIFRSKYPTSHVFVVGGGVAANESIRKKLEECVNEQGFKFVAPPRNLCGDNGAMIAWAGIERLRRGFTDQLNFPARPRWPLDAPR